MATYVGLGIAAAAGLLIVALLRFARAQTEALRNLCTGARIVETARGEVELARVGDGPVVLSLHGGLGGWDQGLVIADQWLELAKHGFSVVAPSRPGYLRTPLEVGRTPEAAADAMAALLHSLGIEEAVVLGTSGGGPTALQLALRHPELTRGLVVFTAITGRHVQPGRTRKRWGWFLFSKYGPLLLDMGWWLVNGMVRRMPRTMLRTMLKATTTKEFDVREEVDYIMAHPKALAAVQKLMDTQIPLSVRKPGLDNDLEAFAALSVYPVEEITCPTLVVHGRLDGNVPFAHGAFVAERVEGAEMHVVEDGGHLVCAGPRAAEVQAAVLAFLKEHASTPTAERR